MHRELKNIVVEASRALAQLDAERLEELALSCQALNRDLALGTCHPVSRPGAAQEVAEDLEVFARVLEATRANLRIMNRLNEMQTGRLEYGERAGHLRVLTMENGHGDD